jgi:hypothetical protein
MIDSEETEEGCGCVVSEFSGVPVFYGGYVDVFLVLDRMGAVSFDTLGLICAPSGDAGLWFFGWIWSGRRL